MSKAYMNREWSLNAGWYKIEAQMKKNVSYMKKEGNKRLHKA